MKPKIIIAIILIALGIALFAYQDITYGTKEKVVDIGPMRMTTKKTKVLPLPAISEKLDCGLHRAADCGKQENLMEYKTFRIRGGYHDGQSKGI